VRTADPLGAGDPAAAADPVATGDPGEESVGEAAGDAVGDAAEEGTGEDVAVAESPVPVPAVAARSCGECGSAVVAARPAARAWIAGLAPGTAPSAGIVPEGSGPGFPWPAERGSAGIPPLPAPEPGAGAGVPCCPVVPALPDPAPSAPPAPRGTVAVAAEPAGEGSAAGATSAGAGDTARITAKDPPPAAATASTDAAIAR
jgi:DNA polymerase-3 subunit gamma/tau